MDFADNFQNRFHFKELHTIDKITSIVRPKKLIEILITKLLVKTLAVFLLSREYFVVRKKKMRIAKNTMDISPAAILSPRTFFGKFSVSSEVLCSP